VEGKDISILDGIGATEMLHIFIGAPEDKIRPDSTGLPVPGYEAKIIDKEGRDLPRGSIGRLAVRGPTGCRYLVDKRQGDYVQNGWNITVCLGHARLRVRRDGVHGHAVTLQLARRDDREGGNPRLRRSVIGLADIAEQARRRRAAAHIRGRCRAPRR
jgi:hypothetical protein